MGKFFFSIDKIFEQRLQMKDYVHLKGYQKELIDHVIQYALNPNPVIRIKRFISYKKARPIKNDLWNISWREMIALREGVKANDIFEVIKVMYKMKPAKVNELELFNCFAAYTWITKQMIAIHEIEMAMLYEEPTEEEKNAGIEELKEFGYSYALRKLTNGDKTKENFWLSLSYAEIFRELCMNKTENKIQKTYQQNVNRKT